MKKYFVIIIAVVLAGCELTVPVELPDQEPRIVVNSFVLADSMWQVEVFTSKVMNDISWQYDINEKATVNIFSGDAFVEQLSFNNSVGKYTSINNLPQAGKTYTIKVDAPDLESVEATTYVPHAVQIEKLEFIKNVRQDADGNWESDLKITFTDNGNQENYYGLSIQKDYAMQPGFYEPVCFSTLDPVFSEGSVAIGDNGMSYICEPVALFNDDLIDGKTYELKVILNQYAYEQAGHLQIKLYTVTREFHLYTRSMRLQRENEGNPFAEPVIVFNNILKGFGIFAGLNFDSELIKVD